MLINIHFGNLYLSHHPSKWQHMKITVVLNVSYG